MNKPGLDSQRISCIILGMSNSSNPDENEARVIDVFSMIQGGAGMTDFRPQSLHPSGGDDHGPVQPSQTLGFADWVESTGAGVQDDRSLAANRLHVRDDLTEPNATDVYDEYGALVAPGMTQVERDAAELAKFKP